MINNLLQRKNIINRFFGFFKSSSLYFISIGINRGMPFLLIPLLTNVLSVESYGYLGIANVIIGLLKTIIGFNPSLFLTSKYYKYTKKEISEILFNQLILIVLSIFFIFFLTMIFYFSPFYTNQPLLKYFPILLLIASFMVFEALVLTIFQMEKKPSLFFLFSIISASLQVFFVYISIIKLNADWQGKIWGDFFAIIFVILIMCIYMISKKYFVFKLSIKKIKLLFNFGLPLLPHTLSLWVMNFVDRFFIETISGIQAVGLYTLAYNVGMGLMLFYDALQRTWQPFFFEYLEKKEYKLKQQIVLLTWLYYILVFGIFFISVFLANSFFPFFVGENFSEAIKFIPWIFLGYSFHGMYRVVAGYLFHLDKNNILARITFSSAIVNAVCNLILINFNGPIGAAQTTAITFFYSFLVVKIYVLKNTNMPWFTFFDFRSTSK